MHLCLLGVVLKACQKNILPIGGLPMFVHGIRLAERLDNVDEFMSRRTAENLMHSERGWCTLLLPR